MLALISQIGISMLVPVLLCVWLGSALESRLGLDLMIWLLLLGFLAGCRNCYLLLKRYVSEDSGAETGREAEDEKQAVKNERPEMGGAKALSKMSNQEGKAGNS